MRNFRVSRNKFGNEPTTIDGQRFDSKKEAGRYLYLKARLMAGEIEGLIINKRLLSYPLVVGGVKVATYEADFRYLEKATGQVVVEDVKGYRTREYMLKRKLMKGCHGIEVAEV
jgi:hypothetical protein